MGGRGQCFIEDSHETIFRMLDDTLCWGVGGCGGWQNALFKIAAKQCLKLLMMLDFDT